MSRIGLKKINIPEGTTISQNGAVLEFKGPQGTLTVQVPSCIEVIIDGALISVKAKEKTIKANSLHGTTRSHINNAVIGVSEGWKKTLEIHGSGYRAMVDNDILEINAGYSHPVKLNIPAELDVKVVKNKIIVSGIEKQVVGQFSAIVREVRKPEPYKGKGIRYSDEHVARKVGKALKASE